MASWIRALLTSTLLAFCIATASAHAAPAPIVFDFEDGLQGWELEDATQRVQTQVLSGEWAIFGDGLFGIGFGGIRTNGIDLTDIESVSLHYFFVSGDESALWFGVDTADYIPGGPNHTITGFFRFESGGPGNPRTRTIDVSNFAGVPEEVIILWRDGCGTEGMVAFIDNITFHPVPEPSSLALLASGLVALVIYRRRAV